ncbi:FtsX-like permease family protein [Motiliproteus sediminis]|uniref:FtsX-like permease family protein n=1 Tax=Motiliproteus sediminis TaxID=1468178 RepID=UPI001AEF9F2F|nr:ABC transporter permease [Motiliproteus sediminis]
MTLSLAVASLALSIALLLAIDTLRTQARQSFINSLSGTDLIVGARTSSINLLLSSVFQVGAISTGVEWSSYQQISSDPRVRWSIPISLGDSHRGLPVIGTTDSFFEHFKYGDQQPLQLQRGDWFQKEHQVVIGAEVARRYGYRLGQELILSHGSGESFLHHDRHAQTLSGILAPTGTAFDRTLFVSLNAIDEIHQRQDNAAHGHDPLARRSARTPEPRTALHSHDQDAHPGHHSEHDEHDEHDEHGEHDAPGMVATPASDDLHSAHDNRQISGFYLGLKQRNQALAMQHMINTSKIEPLTAVMPGVALLELWHLVSVAENALLLVSALVLLVSLVGMLIILLNSLQQRRREMSMLRAIGARPYHIVTLILGEALVILLLGLLLGLGLLYGSIALAQPWLLSQWGIDLHFQWLSLEQIYWLAGIVVAGLVISLIPAVHIYYYTLADGLSARH